MAAPRILSRSRSLFTTKQTLSSSLLSRPFSSATTTTSTPTAFSLCRIRPFASFVGVIRNPAFSSTSFRSFSSSQSQASLSDNNPNWSNRPPKETILLDGCDFEHWLVVTEPPPETATRDEIIDSYIKTLAQIVGSEEEARMKIYSVSTKHYYAFGALVSEELSYKLKELPHVRWVLPDSYLDVKNKDYGGEPFINGQAVPYDPKYHEDWVRNNAKAQERNRRNDRPRNSDRSRNFDRRQDRNTNYQNPGPAATMGGPGGNRGGPPNADGRPNYPGGAPNMPHNNAGYAPNAPYNNAGYAPNAPHNNAGHAPNAPYNNAGHAPNAPYNNAGHAPNAPYNNAGYAPHNNAGYAPHNNAGYAQHNPGSAHNAPPNNQNREGMPPQGNPGYPGNNVPNYQTGGVMPYQNTPIGNQNFAPPNRNVGGQPVGEYHPQDVPGRDMPNY